MTKMKKTVKRILAGLVSAVMVVSAMCFTAFAETESYDYLVNVASGARAAEVSVITDDALLPTYYEVGSAFEVLVDLGSAKPLEEVSVYFSYGVGDVEPVVTVLDKDQLNPVELDAATVTDTSVGYMIGTTPVTANKRTFAVADSETGYRYIKYSMTGTWHRLYGIEAMADNVNVAKYASVTINGTGTSSLSAGYLTDGAPLSTYLEVGTANYNVVIDLGVEKEVNELVVWIGGGATPYTLTLESEGGDKRVLDASESTYDESQYTNAYDYPVGKRTYKPISDGKKYRYITYAVNQAWLRTYEIEVIEKHSFESGEANIALGKKAIKTDGTDMSALVDGNDFYLNELFMGTNYIVDLGAYYPVDAVIAYGRADGYYAGDNIKFWLSPDFNINANYSTLVKAFGTGDAAMKQGDNVIDVADKTSLYRYLVIENPSYTCMTEVKVIAARNSEVDNAGNLAYNKPVFTSSCNAGAVATMLNGANQSGGYVEFHNLGFPNSGYSYVQIDLGNTYDIGKVVVTFRSWADDATERNMWAIQFSNDVAFANATSPYILTTAPALGEDWVIDVPETANYRYVRLMKIDKGYGLVQEIAVYAKNNTEKAKPTGLYINKNFYNEKPLALESEIIEGVKLNPGYELNDSKVITAVYSDGALKALNVTDFASTAEGSVKCQGDDNYLFGKDEQTLKFDWALPLELDEDGKTLDSVKVFVWNGFHSLSPITEILDVKEGTLISIDKDVEISE